jgi:hypothetical protein
VDYGGSIYAPAIIVPREWSGCRLPETFGWKIVSITVALALSNAATPISLKFRETLITALRQALA